MEALEAAAVRSSITQVQGKLEAFLSETEVSVCVYVCVRVCAWVCSWVCVEGPYVCVCVMVVCVRMGRWKQNIILNF
jgi:hypothetical protein